MIVSCSQLKIGCFPLLFEITGVYLDFVVFFFGGGRFPTCEYCDGSFRSAETHFTIDGYWIIFSSFGISHSRHSDRVMFVFEPCFCPTSVR